LSIVVTPIKSSSDVIDELSTDCWIDELNMVTTIATLLLHGIAEGLKLVPDLFPVQEILVYCIKLLFKKTELFFGLRRDGMGRGVEFNSRGN